MPSCTAPSVETLLTRLKISLPVIGLYDAPDPEAFAPLVAPQPRAHTCVWAFYGRWLKGETAHLTAAAHGCGGCGRAWFGVQTRGRDEFLAFLADEEGLRASRELMGRWLDTHPSYAPRHGHLLVGPLRHDQYEHLLTATFLVDPDQLSAFVIGAHYHAAPEDPAPVLADFGSGCMGLIEPFADLGVAQAAIGATDIAMRSYLPPQVLAFTVTRPLLERLASLDERSFLFKPFLQDLQAARARRGD
jgi:hypothetical protein